MNIRKVEFIKLIMMLMNKLALINNFIKKINYNL